jgi:pyruvate formate lyase activating enzyme
MPEIDENEILDLLHSKKGWVDAVCITGGEPTMNPALVDIMSEIKALGYKVKLDTNGTKPGVLRELLGMRLIDAVAMDIKTVFGKYPLATGVTRDFSCEVGDSMKLFVEAHKRGDIELEFRTTVVPGLVEPDDVVEIARSIRALYAMNECTPGSMASSCSSTTRCNYYLQQFNPKTVMKQEMGEVRPYTVEQMEGAVARASEYVVTVLRGC